MLEPEPEPEPKKLSLTNYNTEAVLVCFWNSMKYLTTFFLVATWIALPVVICEVILLSTSHYFNQPCAAWCYELTTELYVSCVPFS